MDCWPNLQLLPRQQSSSEIITLLILFIILIIDTLYSFKDISVSLNRGKINNKWDIFFVYLCENSCTLLNLQLLLSDYSWLQLNSAADARWIIFTFHTISDHCCSMVSSTMAVHYWFCSCCSLFAAVDAGSAVAALWLQLIAAKLCSRCSVNNFHFSHYIRSLLLYGFIYHGCTLLVLQLLLSGRSCTHLKIYLC